MLFVFWYWSFYSGACPIKGGFLTEQYYKKIKDYNYVEDRAALEDAVDPSHDTDALFAEGRNIAADPTEVLGYQNLQG